MVYGPAPISGLNAFRLTGPALRDVRGILAFTRSRFGDQAADRYQALLLKAFLIIRADPLSPLTHAFGGRPAVRIHHLRSTPQQRPRPVNRPRHFIVFRHEAGAVVVLRVLHDRMDLTRQMD